MGKVLWAFYDRRQNSQIRNRKDAAQDALKPNNPWDGGKKENYENKPYLGLKGFGEKKRIPKGFSEYGQFKWVLTDITIG
jgi:hypothetical protein